MDLNHPTPCSPHPAQADAPCCVPSSPAPLSALTASYFTLGCKLNFSETSTIGRILKEKGIGRAPKGAAPDICVVNTCSVTEMADKKGRSLIRRLHRLYPEARIVVTGCYAQLKPEEVAGIEGVDIVLGSNEKLRIAEYIDSFLRDEGRGTRLGARDEGRGTKKVSVKGFREIREFQPSCERGDRTRFFLKVQDGCDYFCTYCTIPYARGRSRSGRIADLVDQARAAAAEGGKEIVITGVNTGCFGQDTGESFLDLLKALDAVEGIERYRISSIEPNLITPEILEWIARESRAFMPHFHIPLQAGSDAVLKKMNRRYDTSLFADRVALIRRLFPDAFIGVDVIAGARGETEEEWQKGLDFISGLDITRLHVFPYSERPGTAALHIDGEVPQEEKHRRVGVLTETSDRKLAAFFHSMEGTERHVLWEHIIPASSSPLSTLHSPLYQEMTGLTDNYIRVFAKADPAKINTITRVRLSGICTTHPESMTAEHV